MNIKEYSDIINKSLLKTVNNVRYEIMQSQDKLHTSKIKEEPYRSPSIDIIEHSALGNIEAGSENPENLSYHLLKLSEKLHTLGSLYETDVDYNDLFINSNEIDISSVSNLFCYFSYCLSNLTEQVANLTEVYKIEIDDHNLKEIRKCLSRINKDIKKMPANAYNESINSFDYALDIFNLNDVLSKLSRRIGKLTKAYKNRFLIKRENILGKRKSTDKMETHKKKQKKQSKEKSVVTEENHSVMNKSINEDVKIDSEIKKVEDSLLTSPKKKKKVKTEETVKNEETIQKEQSPKKNKNKIKSEIFYEELSSHSDKNSDITAQKTKILSESTSDFSSISEELLPNKIDMVKQTISPKKKKTVNNIKTSEENSDITENISKYEESSQDLFNEMKKSNNEIPRSPNKHTYFEDKSNENKLEEIAKITENCEENMTNSAKKKKFILKNDTKKLKGELYFEETEEKMDNTEKGNENKMLNNVEKEKSNCKNVTKSPNKHLHFEDVEKNVGKLFKTLKTDEENILNNSEKNRSKKSVKKQNLTNGHHENSEESQNLIDKYSENDKENHITDSAKKKRRKSIDTQNKHTYFEDEEINKQNKIKNSKNEQNSNRKSSPLKNSPKKDVSDELNNSKNHNDQTTLENLSDEEILEMDDGNGIFRDLVGDRTYLMNDEKFLNCQTILEEVQEKYKLTKEMKKKLRQLCILVDWDVPPSHRIETRLVIGPKKEQRESLNQFDIKCGPFTKVEDNKILQNWAQFCKEYNFYEARPFLKWEFNEKQYLPHDQRKIFVQYLGKDLPHRMLSSIYRRFRILMQPVRKGRFTSEEDALILQHVQHVRGNEPRFAPIAQALNRSQRSIETRYKTLVEGTFGIEYKVHWTLEKNEEMISMILLVMVEKDVDNLRTREIPNEKWWEISDRLAMPLSKVKNHWYIKLYTQLFSERPLIWNQINLDVIQRLVDLKANDWKTVDWQGIARKYFPGIKGHFLWFALKSKVRHYVPPQISKDLKKCLKYLVDVAVPQIKTKLDDDKKGRQLTRFRWIDEKLQPYK